MVLYVCRGCGKKMETLPLHCGQDMIFNQETNQIECYMGSSCGYLSLDELKCEDCCKKQKLN